MGKCLRFFTDLDQAAIAGILAEHGGDPGRRVAQRHLAVALTRLVHGEPGLAVAQRATEIFFGAEISELSDGQLDQIFADVPSKELPRQVLGGQGLAVIDAFVAAGLAQTKGEARRLIAQGGTYVNNRRVDGIDMRLGVAQLASQSVMVLRTGKKNYALLRFMGSP